MLPLLETHFGKWQPAAGRVSSKHRRRQFGRPPRQLLLVDMPDAPQSRILVGGVSASSSMADLFPIQVLNTVLRGRFSSARNPTLRDYTAGVRSGFDMRKSAGPFVVATAAQGHKTAESLGEVLNELTGILKGIPADELARAKDDIALEFSRTFEATGRISSRLQALESLVDLRPAGRLLLQYAPAIQAVGADDVRRVAHAIHRPRPSRDRDRRRPEDHRAAHSRARHRITHDGEHRRIVSAGEVTEASSDRPRCAARPHLAPCLVRKATPKDG